MVTFIKQHGIFIFIVIVQIFWIAMLIDCCKRKFQNKWEQILWIIIMIVGNFIVSLIYYFLIRRPNAEGILKRGEEGMTLSKKISSFILGLIFLIPALIFTFGIGFCGGALPTYITGFIFLLAGIVLLSKTWKTDKVCFSGLLIALLLYLFWLVLISLSS